MRFKRTILICCLGLLALGGCQKERTISGKTMGTTYHVKVISGALTNMDKVQQQVDERLEQINHSMSTYRDDSEITLFNNSKTVGKPFAISGDFLKVMEVARQLYEQTQGAWDGTVNPLVNLWGFGRSGDLTRIPSKEARKSNARCEF